MQVGQTRIQAEDAHPYSLLLLSENRDVYVNQVAENLQGPVTKGLISLFRKIPLCKILFFSTLTLLLTALFLILKFFKILRVDKL